MTSRLSPDELEAAIAAGETAGGTHRSFRTCPESDPRLKRGWLQGWIQAAIGGASRRAMANAAELRASYLAAFHAEQPAPRRAIDGDAWDLIDTARALHPPLPWEVLGAILGRNPKTISVRACQQGKTRRAA